MHEITELLLQLFNYKSIKQLILHKYFATTLPIDQITERIRTIVAIKCKSLLGDNFFEQVGGHTCLRRVHNLLYTKLFVHPWLKGFFVRTRREVVESQQADFWTSLMGGPQKYCGRSPRDAHIHMFMPAEVFSIRHELLGKALAEAGVAPHLREKWLMLDSGFERAIVNKSPSECHGRYRSETVLVVPKPTG